MASLLRFGLKASIVGGTIYFTIEQGVWKNSNETTLLYGKIYKNIVPLVQGVTKEVDFEIPDLPKAEDLWYSMQNGYNKGIIATSRFLCSLPSNTVDWTRYGIDMAMKQIEQVPTADATLKK